MTHDLQNVYIYYVLRLPPQFKIDFDFEYHNMRIIKLDLIYMIDKIISFLKIHIKETNISVIIERIKYINFKKM